MSYHRDDAIEHEDDHDDTPVYVLAEFPAGYWSRPPSIAVLSPEPFWRRLWYVISNPFCYLLTGKIRW